MYLKNRFKVWMSTLFMLVIVSSGDPLYATGGDALFIDQNGNVGIGTQTPAATLDVKGRIMDESGLVMPRGGIIMWSGEVSNIPKGWALCDGSNGTPDLRGRFICGADSAGTIKPNDRGEADAHSHTIATEPMQFSTTYAGGHDHQTNTQGWYTRNQGGGIGSGNSLIDCAGQDVGNARTSTMVDHAHNVSVDLRSYKTGVYNGQNRPRWYALCFIMKL